MACKKYMIYHSVEKTSVSNLYKFLNQYAVPDYFSRVEYDDDLSITCYNTLGSTEYSTMIINKSSGSIFVTIYYNNSNGYGRSSSKHGSSSDSSKAKYFVAGYVTDNGIAISASNGNNTDEGTMVVMITKDNRGNTAIITESSTFGYMSSGTAYIAAGNGYEHAQVCQCKAVTVPSIAVTTLSPILMPDYKGGYTPNVYVMPFAENRSVGILEFNGKRYLSNGIICMKCDNEENTT